MRGLLSSHNLTFSQKLFLKFQCNAYLVGFGSSLYQSAETSTWNNGLSHALIHKNTLRKLKSSIFYQPRWLDGTDLGDNKQEQQQLLLGKPISTSVPRELPYYPLVQSQMSLFAVRRWIRNCFIHPSQSIFEATLVLALLLSIQLVTHF